MVSPTKHSALLKIVLLSESLQRRLKVSLLLTQITIDSGNSINYNGTSKMYFPESDFST